MKKKNIDLVRILAVVVIVVAIIYFYINIFKPAFIPKSFRLGILRKPLTILIVGTDITFDAVTHKPMPERRGRADTIMLVHLNPIKWEINALSIPRDTYLFIPGYGVSKINAANAYGGIPSLKKAVANLIEKKIDYYIKIKPTAITKMVDVLGGITIFVDKDMRYTDRAQNLDINIKKGWQKLDGKQAHDYIRYRNDIRGDIGRIERHQIFLKSLLKSLINPLNVFKSPLAINTALHEIETDLPLSTMVRILNMARSVALTDINTSMISGEVSFIDGAGSVWLPNKEYIKRTVRELL